MKGWPRSRWHTMGIHLFLARQNRPHVLGPTGTLLRTPTWRSTAAWARNYVWQRYTTIGAGPTEVQKNIIADRALKLER